MRWLSTAARTCAPKRVLSMQKNEQTRSITSADDDQEQAVAGEVDAAELRPSARS